MANLFRNKTFKGLRWQKKVQRILQEKGLTLSYYLREPQVDTADFHFLCCLRYNRNHFIFEPLPGGDRQYLQPAIFLFSEDVLEVSINGKPFEDLKLNDWNRTDDLIRKQLQEQIYEDRLFSWKMDQMHTMTIRLKSLDPIRKHIITDYHEANVYKFEADFLRQHFQRWINENLSTANKPEDWVLISERLRFINVNVSCDDLHKNAREISSSLTSALVVLPMLDVAELLYFVLHMRERGYNQDLLERAQREAEEVAKKQQECLAKFLKD